MPVFYGLGDFMFDVEHFGPMPEVDESVLVILEFTRNGQIHFHPSFTRFDRQHKRLECSRENRWFRELSPATFAQEYRDYARSKFEEWMIIQNDHCLKPMRKLRRVLGMALNLRNPYMRPVLCAAYQSLFLDRVCGKPTVMTVKTM